MQLREEILCTRGLETRESKLERRMRMTETVLAVLTEQDRQLEQGTYSARRISQVSRNKTRASAKAARARAMKLSQQVQTFVKSTPLLADSVPSKCILQGPAANKFVHTKCTSPVPSRNTLAYRWNASIIARDNTLVLPMRC